MIDAVLEIPRYKTWILATACSVLLLPFVGQAFHIDDVGFIYPSLSLAWNPLAGGFQGGTHSAFMPYFIKIITTLFNHRELTLHLAFLIFPVIALLALRKLYAVLYKDAQDRDAFLLLIIASTPAFVVNAHTVMADVPALAFLLAGAACFLLALDQPRKRFLILAGISLTLAVFAVYQTIVIIPVLFLYAGLRKKLNLQTAAVLAAPIAVLCLWIVLVYKLASGASDQGVFSRTVTDISGEVKRGLTMGVFGGKVAGLCAHLGMASLFLILAYHGVKGSVKNFLLKGTLIAATCYFPVSRLVTYPFMQMVLLLMLIAVGLLTVAEVFSLALTRQRGKMRPRELFLLVWILAVLAYNIFVLPFAAARYLLPALPPIAMMLVGNADWHIAGTKERIAVVWLLILAFAFGLACSYADYRYAGVYKDFAAEVRNFRMKTAQPPAIWYIGAWGMTYYMDQEGCKPLVRGSQEPRKGDLVIVPEMPRLWEPSVPVMERMVPFATRTYSSIFPLKLFNRRSNAGFYAHHWGLLPFSLSREPDELFQIWRITS